MQSKSQTKEVQIASSSVSLLRLFLIIVATALIGISIYANKLYTELGSTRSQVKTYKAQIVAEANDNKCTNFAPQFAIDGPTGNCVTQLESQINTLQSENTTLKNQLIIAQGMYSNCVVTGCGPH